MIEAEAEYFANPSSLHSLGRKSKKKLNEARDFVAKTINAQEEEIIFTSGATEANNFIFKSLSYDLIIASPAEHACVIEAAKASRKPIHWLSLSQEGLIDINELSKVIEQNSDKKILVSIMHGNNEIGTLQDLKQITALKDKYTNFIFHSDAAQTFSKHPIDVQELKLDAISVSAHKIHGPKGIGFTFLRKALADEVSLGNFLLLSGGGQENNLRSGTENLPGILGLTKAIELAQNPQGLKHIKTLSDKLYQGLQEKVKFKLNGANLENRIIGNFNISLLDCKLKSEELVLQLDLNKIAVSSGSACSSNKNDGEAGILSSYVLRACGIPEPIAQKAIRISISRFNTLEEVEKLIQIIEQVNLRFKA